MLNKKKVLNIAKIATGFLLIFLLIKYLGTSEALSLLTETKWYVAPLLIFSILFIALLNAINFHLLAKGLNKKITFKKMFKISMISWSAARLMPGNLGDLSLIPQLKQENFEYGEATALVIIDKAINLIVTLILSILALVVLLGWKNTILTSAVLLVPLIAFTTLLFTEKFRTRIRNKFLPKIIKRNAKGFSSSLKQLLIHQPTILTINVVLTFIKLFSAALIFYFVFLSYGLAVPIITILSIKALGSVVSYLPISPGGLGLKEGAIALGYIGFGYDPLIPGIVYILSRFFLFILAIAIGLFSLKHIQLSTKNQRTTSQTLNTTQVLAEQNVTNSINNPKQPEQ